MNSNIERIGINHTPEYLANFIIRFIDEFLKSDLFQFTDGISNNNLKILDVATGIGTYVTEIYKYILDQSKIGINKQVLVDNYLLRNVYGFDINSDVIERAKRNLYQCLKERNIDVAENQNLNLYNVDTLAELDNENIQIDVKEKVHIIVGTPPFTQQNQDSNKQIKLLLDDYKASQKIYPNLKDQYVQFVRYAQYKLKNRTKGIIAFVLNDVFLRGVSFQEMRKSLYIDFDQIYILKIQDSQYLNTKDEGLLPVKIGLSIIFLIKVEKKVSKQINFYSLIDHNLDTRGKKIKFLNEHSFKSINWEIIPLNSKFSLINNRLNSN